MLETIVSFLGAALLCVVGWAFSINSRVSVLEAQHEALITLINTKFDDMGRRLTQVETAIMRIEGRFRD